ncbi:hypothetical protein ANN_16627 [Periplaneta americana]|uniref:Uncharacterized protein n=1 Tax=Periplaneta americana TaxID=6978 RepID=A0ABQ8SS16_PERAM|nr:hypothetical protein ANN_16627 [Periplaneta americana]
MSDSRVPLTLRLTILVVGTGDVSGGCVAAGGAPTTTGGGGGAEDDEEDDGPGTTTGGAEFEPWLPLEAGGAASGGQRASSHGYATLCGPTDSADGRNNTAARRAAPLRLWEAGRAKNRDGKRKNKKRESKKRLPPPRGGARVAGECGMPSDSWRGRGDRRGGVESGDTAREGEDKN